MRRAFALVVLSLLLPLASSLPAIASKVYTIHNKLEWPIVVTFSTQACKPYSFQHSIGAKTTGTITAACGTLQIDVVPTSGGKPLAHHHCWSNVRYYPGYNFNIMPASSVMGYCTVNAVAPGL